MTLNECLEAYMENAVTETIANETFGEWLQRVRKMSNRAIAKLFDGSYTYGGNITKAEARTGRIYTDPEDILRLGTRSVSHICFKTSDDSPEFYIAAQTMCSKPATEPLFQQNGLNKYQGGYRKNTVYRNTLLDKARASRDVVAAAGSTDDTNTSTTEADLTNAEAKKICSHLYDMPQALRWFINHPEIGRQFIRDMADGTTQSQAQEYDDWDDPDIDFFRT